MNLKVRSAEPFTGGALSRRAVTWRLGVAFLLVVLGLLLLCFERGPHARPMPPISAAAYRPTSGTRTLFKKPIEQVGVGDRVLGENPTGERDDTLGEFDSATWRRLELRAPKRDGGIASVTLLRPRWWLEANSAEVGGSVEISVPECGIDGRAEVLAIADCPRITDGPGHVVIGTFQHPAAHLVSICLEGEESPITSTPNHPFWSEDRQAFVRADELKPGEQLRAQDRLCHVTLITPLDQLAPVFNLEVHGTHVYRVGTQGILVHNGQPCPTVLSEMLNSAQAAAPELVNKTLASAPDGGIYVSGAGVFESRAAGVLETTLKGHWVRSSRDRIQQIINYFNKKNVPLTIGNSQEYKDFALEIGGQPVVGSARASHAELQAAFDIIVVARTTAERAKLLTNGEVVINIAKTSGPLGPCSPCQAMLRMFARFENVPIRVNWMEGSNPRTILFK